jgi:hypothetical protein
MLQLPVFGMTLGSSKIWEITPAPPSDASQNKHMLDPVPAFRKPVRHPPVCKQPESPAVERIGSWPGTPLPFAAGIWARLDEKNVTGVVYELDELLYGV